MFKEWFESIFVTDSGSISLLFGGIPFRPLHRCLLDLLSLSRECISINDNKCSLVEWYCYLSYSDVCRESRTYYLDDVFEGLRFTLYSSLARSLYCDSADLLNFYWKVWRVVHFSLSLVSLIFMGVVTLLFTLSSSMRG